MRELAGHAGLQVEVLRLGLERDIDQHLPVAVHLDQSRLRPGLGEHVAPVADGGDDWTVFTSDCVPCSPEDDLAVPRDLDGPAAGKFLALADGEEDVAAGRDHPSRVLAG